jgi:hypothetical protein
MTRLNSIKAHNEERRALSKRENAILLLLRSRNTPMTDREIVRSLGFSDMNAVRPRVTELVTKGYVREVGSVRCEITGKTVRRVWAPLKAWDLPFKGDFPGQHTQPYTHKPPPGGSVTIADGVSRAVLRKQSERLPGL